MLHYLMKSDYSTVNTVAYSFCDIGIDSPVHFNESIQITG